MNVKTKLRAGKIVTNHNDTLVRVAAVSPGLRIRTGITGGKVVVNHNESLVRARVPCEEAGPIAAFAGCTVVSSHWLATSARRASRADR